MRHAMLRSLVLAPVLAPAAALAHPGHGSADGLLHGMLHTLPGVEHLLAVLIVLGLAIAAPAAWSWLARAACAVRTSRRTTRG